ncbi:MAG: hypothetical protein LBK83_02760 [Treponema sp.]|jgi:hypothetical protein|nr:hypothetical protein [Treponema sp.]
MKQNTMLPLKPSTHRKCFIDRKIRENSYPTAASLARDYRAEYGKKIDPRTIANDIADMRRELNAPIHYDNEKGGYVYTNSSFMADIFSREAPDIPLRALGISGLSALGLDRDLLPLVPSSVFLSDWHRNLLRTVAEKVTPAGRNRSRGLGKITVIQLGKWSSFPVPDIENTIREALELNRELSILYAGSGNADLEFLIRPYHLVYLKKDGDPELGCFLLGEVAGGGSIPYALLNAAGIKKAALLDKMFNPVKAVHVHQVDDTGIEFLVVNEKKDTLLIFFAYAAPAGSDMDAVDFSLLSRMDIFTDEAVSD